MKNKLAEAMALRKENKPEEAEAILKTLLQSYPDDPDVNYQMAWTCDFMGKESAAVPFYEKAISSGLKEDRDGAMLGLGSTYRCLGEYEKSVSQLLIQLLDTTSDSSIKSYERALRFYSDKLNETWKDS